MRTQVTSLTGALCISILALLTTACDSGGKKSPAPAPAPAPAPTPTPTPTPPAVSKVISVTATNIAEGDAGTTTVEFTVTLDKATSAAASLNYSTTDGSAVAADNDYTAKSGSLNIGAGQSSAKVEISVNGDTTYENNETFSLSLSNASGISLSVASGAVTILNDDVGGLNNTGVSSCSAVDGDTALVCTGISAAQTRQDKDFATAPFSFSDVVVGECVKDNNTGLYWELKTNAAGVHRLGHFYAWQDNNSSSNGGNAGAAGNAGANCDLAGGASCNTTDFIATVNAANFCGFNDWRLPTVSELRSIVDYGKDPLDLMIADKFTLEGNLSYWTSNSYIPLTSKAFTVTLNTGVDTLFDKNNASTVSVRLVRN